MTRWIVGLLALFCVWLCTARASAGQAEFETGVRALASSDAEEQSKAVERIAKSGAKRALAVLTALKEQRLSAEGSGKVAMKTDSGFVDAVSGVPLPAQSALRQISLNNLLRRTLNGSLARLQLTAEDVNVRSKAAREIAEFPNQETADLLRPLVDREPDEEVRTILALAIAKVDVTSPDRTRRLAAAKAIQAAHDVSLETELKRRVARNPDGSFQEPDPEVRGQLRMALVRIQRRIFFVNMLANAIYGLSLGSVLLLAALGLAITFGLMGVINMAHGEMLMIGAYSTFVVRTVFLQYLTAFSEWYLIAAIPVAFIATGLVGVALERTVIRFLYGRPLETLLATWGLSLVLIQAVRTIFGAQNVTVANPEWLSGGWELLPALILPYSRVAVLVFTSVVVSFVWFVLRRTSLGLKVRSVTQNRDMAASLGIATHRVDMWTFGLGCALAGLGGVALSQLGNVGPELGQQHIVDSFMVVVLGGVGNVLGTIAAALGLGIANKLIEPSTGAVLGKIILLGLLILFIQWRPQGIFALKGGRGAES